MAFKGDLKNVQLADLFQTLAQNRQEGVLTLSSRGRTHRVHFSHEGVTLLDPAVAGRRRLGEILISAGLCSDKDITEALREQAKSKKFLGEVLIEKGRVTQDQLASILGLQVEEEIYELFRTEGGLFEFSEGQPDNVTDRSPSKVRPLPVDHVVMEAARRLDEWGQIQQQIPSLDDVYVATVDPAGFTDDEELLTVLKRLDGRHDVRDVADALLSSPFTVAKVLVRLLEAEATRACRPDELFASAQHLLAGGSKTRALKLLHRLTASESSSSFTNEVAEMYRLAGDSKSAAKTRLRIAQDSRAAGGLDEARHQLEAALREWPSASAVLEPLVAVLRDLGDGEAELRHVRDLADVLADAGANEGALKAMERVLELAPADFDARRKYSDLCLRARLKEKAIEVLEQEVTRLKKRDGGGVELAAIYKRILSIDAGRKDVKRALARLRRTRADRLLRAGLIITVGVGLLALAGIVGVRWRQKTVGLARIEAARAQLEAGNLDQARKAVSEVLNSSSRPEVVQPAMTLLDQIDARVTEANRSRRGERDDAFNKQLAAIQEQASRLNYDVAFSDCTRMLQTELEPYMVERVDARLLMIKQSFLDHIARAKECARNYHEPERDEDVPAAFKKMNDAFPVELVALLPNVRTVAFESAQKLKSPPRDWMLEILTAVDSFDLLLARVKPALDALRTRNVRLSTLQQLSIDYLEAVRMAEAGNIERSRELLRKVRDEYGQGELRAVLDKRLQRLDAAAACIQEIEEHLQRKEYSPAHDRALAAAREYRDLQIPSTLGIPVLLKSVPPGARIVVDGKEEGHAPLLLRVPLGSKPAIHATLDHYTPADTTVDPAAGAEQAVELERARVAEANLQAKLVAAPIWHEGRVCAASRDGVLYSVEFGKADPVVKSLRTGSVSGSLVPPVGTPKGFVAAVFEGKVWRVDASGPEMVAVWSHDLKEETRSPLFVVGDLVLVTTDNGRVVALALADGTPTFEVALNGRRVVGAPVWTGTRLVVPLAGGALAVVDPAARTLEGVHDTGADLVGALASDGVVVVATSSTGRLLAFDAKTYAQRASVDLDDLPAEPARIAWPRADVVVRHGIAVVDLAAQKVVRTVEATPTPTSAPVLLDGLLFVGSEKGVLCAFDPEGDEARLRLHLPSNAAVGAPIATPLGWLAYTRDGALVILQR